MNKKLHFKTVGHKLLLTALCLIIGVPWTNAAPKAESSQLMQKNSEKKISLNIKNSTIKIILQEITQKSGIGFFYKGTNDNDFKEARSIKVTDMPVSQILNQLFKDTKYAYSLSGNLCTITLKQASKAAQPQGKKSNYSGIIINSKGEPVVGATLVVKGTQIGTSTNGNGEFSVGAAANDVLILTCVGMERKEYKLGTGTTLKIVMKESIETVDDVVVNGMFTQSKNSYTGAVTTIKGDDLVKLSQTNIIQALAMSTPGMRIVENNEQGSNPNVVPEIIIRGTTSISTDGQLGLNRPLIVLDGVEITLEQLYDLDMFDIDRVDVLKDASATAIYGDRAANGVIVVQRKRVTDSKLKVRYNFVPNIQFPDVSSFNLCSSAQKLELERLYGLYDSPRGEYDELYNQRLKRVNAGVFTDWASIPLRNTTSMSHSMNFSGRGGGMDYSVNANFSDTRGVMKGDYRMGYGLGFYFAYNLQDKLTVSLRSDWSKGDSKDSPYGGFADFVRLNPYDEPKNEYGEWNTLLSYEQYNPLYEAAAGNFQKSMYKSFSNNVSVRWDAFKNFLVNGTFNYSWSDNRSDAYRSPESAEFRSVSDPDQKGYYQVSGANGIGWNGNVTASYNINLNEDKTSILTLRAGGEFARSKSDGYTFKTIGYLSSKFKTLNFGAGYPANDRPGGNPTLSSRARFYSNLNFIVKNRYFLDASFSTSGSSNYAARNLFSPYWSLGAGWNASNEKFLKFDWLTSLRFTGSIGYVGSGNFGGIKAESIYKYTSEYMYYVGLGTIPISMGNPDLKSQKTLSTNLGVNLSVLEGRFDVQFNIYRQKTTDVLMSISLPASSGIESVMANMGETLNRGYDLSVSVMPIQVKDFYLRLSLNTGFTKNTVKKISAGVKKMNDANKNDNSTSSPKIQIEEGESIDAIYAVPSLGIDPASGLELFLKKDGTYTFTIDNSDKRAMGVTTPKFDGNIFLTFGYKRVSVSAAMRLSVGAYLFNATRASKIEFINPRYNVDQRAFTDRWKKPGDLSNYIRIDKAVASAAQHSSRFIEKRNEFTLSSLSISYEVNPNWVKWVGMKRLLVGVTFSDVMRLSTVKFERGTQYPFMRAFNFRFSPTF